MESLAYQELTWKQKTQLKTFNKYISYNFFFSPSIIFVRVFPISRDNLTGHLRESQNNDRSFKKWSAAFVHFVASSLSFLKTVVNRRRCEEGARMSQNDAHDSWRLVSQSGKNAAPAKHIRKPAALWHSCVARGWREQRDVTAPC